MYKQTQTIHSSLCPTKKSCKIIALLCFLAKKYAIFWGINASRIV